MSNRHLARTIAMQSLFLWDFKGKDNNDLDNIIKGVFLSFAPSFDDQGFVKKITDGVVKNLDDIDKYIIKYATEWPLEQITIVDRNILRIGVYELYFADDIPPKVAINEAIEIAKAYGGESSGKFVNGVLGAIYKDMPEDKKNVASKKQEEKEYDQTSSGGLIFRKEGNDYKFVLILDAYDKWTFPKGKISEEESAEEAAVRELQEETGLRNLKVLDYLDEKEVTVNNPGEKPLSKLIKYYLIETEDSEIKVPQVKELKDVRWFEEKEALETIGYKNAKDVFKKGLKKIKNK